MRKYEELMKYSDPSVDIDAFKSVKDMCNENGYNYEEYSIVTEDGYILSLMRIPGQLGEAITTGKPVVLF